MKESNKRIAKNTIFVNIRLLVTMVIGLFSSRFVLQLLGVSDYGLYNVVGGVLAMITFVASSLGGTTTRFINYEMGKKDGDPNLVFNVNNVVHIVCALIIFILAESIGIFYIVNYLNVNPGKESDAMFVFQVSTIVACLGIINAPYAGLLAAHEQFGITSLVSIANTVFNFGLVLLLFFYSGNVLRMYAFMMSLSTFITFVTYHWICYKRWPNIIKWNIRKTKSRYKDVLVYNNYNLLSSCALMFREQGSNILINYFFGTTTNGAYAIARTVRHYVETLSANLSSAAGPQVVKYMGGNSMEGAESIVNRVGRFCFLLMEIVLFPLLVELDYVLHLWLGKVPEGALLFCYYTIALTFVSLTSVGITQVINGTGKIKWFKIQFSVLYFLCVPIGYWTFKKGSPPQTILALFIVADLISRINQLILLKRIVGFNSFLYMKEVYLRPFLIALIMFVIILLIKMNPLLTNNLLNIAVTFVFSVFFVIVIGLKNEERKIVKNMCLTKFKNGKNKN